MQLVRRPGSVRVSVVGAPTAAGAEWAATAGAGCYLVIRFTRARSTISGARVTTTLSIALSFLGV
jgi:hypothetical protein